MCLMKNTSYDVVELFEVVDNCEYMSVTDTGSRIELSMYPVECEGSH